jgi:hypothetical protein
MIGGSSEEAQAIGVERDKTLLSDFALVQALGFRAEFESATLEHRDAPMVTCQIESECNSGCPAANDADVRLNLGVFR